MGDDDTKLKVLQTFTYSTTQFGCKFNIARTHRKLLHQTNEN
jgi:hypothetical protein